MRKRGEGQPARAACGHRGQSHRHAAPKGPALGAEGPALGLRHLPPRGLAPQRAVWKTGLPGRTCRVLGKGPAQELPCHRGPDTEALGLLQIWEGLWVTGGSEGGGVPS